MFQMQMSLFKFFCVVSHPVEDEQRSPSSGLGDSITPHSGPHPGTTPLGHYAPGPSPLGTPRPRQVFFRSYVQVLFFPSDSLPAWLLLTFSP